MRLAAMACALMVILCVAVFGAILSQKSSVPMPSSFAGTSRTERTCSHNDFGRPGRCACCGSCSKARRGPRDDAERHTGCRCPPVAPAAATVGSAPAPVTPPASSPTPPQGPTVLAQNAPSFAAAPGAPTAQAPAPAPAPSPSPALPSAPPLPARVTRTHSA